MTPEEQKKRRKFLIETSDGIWAPHRMFYQRALQYSCSRALKSYASFNSSLQATSNASEVFASLQEALMHAGGVSRFFFPISARNNPHADARRASLREIYGVNECSPLRPRELRNALEHFDERLDDFLLEDPVGVCIPDPIISPNDISKSESDHLFKHLNPQKKTAVILGKSYEYGGIMDEIRKIWQKGKHDV